MQSPLRSSPPSLGRGFWPGAYVPLLLWAGFFALFCFHAWQYYPFIADDALISFRYAERLLAGQGLTWTEGRPVEGYSNLLWLLLVAGLGWLGMDLIAASRLLGVLCMAAVLYAMVRSFGPPPGSASGCALASPTPPQGGGDGYSERVSWYSWLPLVTALLFIVTATPMAVWFIGGLEQPLYAALLAFVILLTVRAIETPPTPAQPNHPPLEGGSERQGQRPPPSRGGDKLSATDKTLFTLSILLGAMCITRPDGPLFTVAALFSIYAARFVTGKTMLPPPRALLLLSMPVLCYGGQTVYRLLYYGEWVPNTALAKVSPSVYHFIEGLKYVGGGMELLSPLSWFAALLLLILPFARPALGIPLLTMGGLWAFYVSFIGGDVFREYRHIVPLIIIFAYALAGGLHYLIEKLAQPNHSPLEGESERQGQRPQPSRWGVKTLNNRCRRSRESGNPVLFRWIPAFAGMTERINQTLRSFIPIIIMTAALLALLPPYLSTQLDSLRRKADPRNAWIWEWVWDCRVTAHLLKQAFHEQQPLTAISAAGCMPYWSQLPVIDTLGINDWYLPRNKPADFGQGWIGHELGSGDYVLRRKPDLIVWHTGELTTRYRTPRELEATDEYHRLYAPVRVRGRDPDNPRRTHRAIIRVRKYDSKLGIAFSESEIRIPAYLFNENERTVAYVNKAGQFVIPVVNGQHAAIILDAPPGTENWQVTVETANTSGDATAITTRLSQQGDSLRIGLSTQAEMPIEVLTVTLRP